MCCPQNRLMLMMLDYFGTQKFNQIRLNVHGRHGPASSDGFGVAPPPKKNPADAPDAGLGRWVVCDPCVVGGWWGGPCSNSNRVQRRSAAVGLVLIPQNYLENQEARDVVPGWEFGPKTNPPISSSRLGGSFWRFSSLASGLGGGGWWVVVGGVMVVLLW